MDIIAIGITAFSITPFYVLRVTKKFIFFAILSLLLIILHSVYLFGPQVLYLLLIIYIVSTAAELLSLKTPLNFFGVKYRYSLKNPFFASKINILGVYPLEVTLAWVILKYNSFVIALLITQAFSLSHFWLILLTPLILVSLDLIIDPVAVNILGLWKWERGTRYFGIPYQNFLGWFFVGLVSSLIFSFVDFNTKVTFHFLYALSIYFYALVMGNVIRIFQIDKTKAILGALPAILWATLGIISLLLL